MWYCFPFFTGPLFLFFLMLILLAGLTIESPLSIIDYFSFRLMSALLQSLLPWLFFFYCLLSFIKMSGIYIYSQFFSHSFIIIIIIWILPFQIHNQCLSFWWLYIIFWANLWHTSSYVYLDVSYLTSFPRKMSFSSLVIIFFVIQYHLFHLDWFPLASNWSFYKSWFLYFQKIHPPCQLVEMVFLCI